MIKLVGRFSLLAFLAMALIGEVTPAIRTRRVVNGHDANPGEFPYQVSVRLRGKHHCGGVIIGTRHILTAAHCVTEINYVADLVIVTGTVSISRGGQSYRAHKFVYHRNYIPGGPGPHDIAIISLATNIVLNPFQYAVRLPPSLVRNGTVAILTGWGQPSVSDKMPTDGLKKLPMTIYHAAVCENRGQSGLINGQICGFAGRGRGACQADSGGPVVVDNILVGIVSYLVPCATGIPDVFTSVYHYNDWIMDAASRI